MPVILPALSSCLVYPGIPLIHQRQLDKAGKITGIFLEMDNVDILLPENLKALTLTLTLTLTPEPIH